jgi:hypothetical protein
MDSLIAYATLKGVNRIYLGAYDNLDPLLDFDLAQNFLPQMNTFLQKAAVAGIEVEALLGDTSWGDPYDPLLPDSIPYKYNYRFPRKLIQDSINASEALIDGGMAGLAGIHLDVEYWASAAYSGGDAATRAEIEQNFLQLLTDAGAMSSLAGIRLAVDLPFWLDTPFASERPTQLADAIALADSVTIMSYFDEHQVIFDQSDGELTLADSLGVEILLGALTKPLDPPEINDWNTFFDENEFIMEKELSLTTGMVGDAEYGEFSGFAVFEYATYSTMPVPEPSAVALLAAPLAGVLFSIARKRR